VCPLNVPLAGGFEVKAIADGEWRTVNGERLYAVETNITNNWNQSMEVNASYLQAFTKTQAVGVEPNATTFKAQSLDIGQSTQFTAYYKVSDAPTVFQYHDPVTGQTVQVPITDKAT